MMKIIFTGGGTGGHIFPAIAVADELRKQVTDAEILFVGAKGRIEEKIVPENNYKLETINITGFNRRNYLKNISLPFRFINALKLCKNILNEFKPDAVVGTGGFASASVVYSASKMKIPTLIQEGNAFPGKVTRYMSSKVDKVVISFDETIKYFKNKNNIIKISYPIRNSLSKISKVDALKTLMLNEKNRTLFVFGGSQGAKAINDVIKNNIEKLFNNNLNIIWQTGKYQFAEINSLCKKYEKNIKVFEFIHDMKTAYSACDIVLCRSGISSIMELSYLKLPCILVPYPLASDDHQTKNAEALLNNNACILIKQKDIETKLTNKILDTINNNSLLNTISNNIEKFSDPDSASKIANEVIKLTLN